MEVLDGDKSIFCYCHFGGNLRENEKSQLVEYKGGRVVGFTIKATTTFDEFAGQLQKRLELRSTNLRLKYVLEFDKTQLIDLEKEEDMHEMMNFSEKFAHVYVFSMEGESESIHHEETRHHPTQCTAKCTSGTGMFDQNNVRQSSNAPIILGNSNLVASCVDAEKYVVTSELWKNEIFGPGQTFTNALAFRDALYRGRMSWRVNANQVGLTDFLRVGNFVNEHSHSAQDVISAKPKVRSKLDARIISTKLRAQPETTPNQIKAAFASEFGVDINYKQSWLCKEQSMRMIHGLPGESYGLVPWLCNRIKEADEHAVTAYEASLDHRFVKVFIAYGCSVQDFLSGCRPIIYIDGCHLSGPYKGTLLSAISFDADNNMFPLAYAIVSAESYDDWHWFLTMIKGVTSSVDVTIVSDRHKNILSSVTEVFGKANHAYCYRHIKENFSAEVRKVLPRGKATKDTALNLLNSIMYARLDIDFQTSLDNLKSLSSELAKWVLENEPEHWVMSKFPKRRWDHVTTNIAESFNAWMLKERRHYVFALMNEHRDKLASLLLRAKEDMKSWKNGVGPNIERKLLVNIVRVETMVVVPYGQYSAKVSTGFADLSVDLQIRTCTCLGWQMSGIPCPHACAAIKKFKGTIYEYVEDWYQLEKQQLIYTTLMVPIETHDMPKKRHDATFVHDMENEEFLSPPTTKRPPGRPRVKRIESQFMEKRKVHCRQCNQIGHNRATCKNPNPS